MIDKTPQELSLELFDALMANNNPNFDFSNSAPSMDGGDVSQMPEVKDLDKWFGSTTEIFTDEDAWLTAGIGEHSSPQKTFRYHIDGKPVTREQWEAEQARLNVIPKT